MLPASSVSTLDPGDTPVVRAEAGAARISLVVVCDAACQTVGVLADEAIRRSEAAFEIVVVDAALSNGAARSALAAVDKRRARVVRTHGRGVTGARNAGVSKTSEEFVCVLGAADVPNADVLTSAVEALNAHPLVAFAALGTSAAGGEGRDPVQFPALLEANTVAGPVLVRRAVIEAVGGFDEDFPAGYQDWDFWITCIERGFGGIRLGHTADGPSQSRAAVVPTPDIETEPYRQLVAKHSASYKAHLATLLGDQEREEVRLQAEISDLKLADYLEGRPQLARAVHELLELERRRRETDPPKQGRPATVMREADEDRDAALRMAEHLARERDEARRELAVLRIQQQLDAAARASQPVPRAPEMGTFERWSAARHARFREARLAGEMNRRIAQPVAIVVRCAEAGPRMWDTLRSIERQSRRPCEVVVVVDPSTPPGSKRWLTAVAAARNYIFVEAADVRPAVVKNAGIRATAAAFTSCVAVGDELHPRFLERTVGALTRRKACAIATTWGERIGPGSRVRADGVEHVTLSGCLSNPDAIDDTAVFRRVDWDSHGGFDEGLEALEGLDLWLGVLEGDASVAVVTEQLVSRRAESQVSRRALEPDIRGRAMARILSRHRASFDAHVADVLAERRTRLHETSTAYQRARARREAATAELQTLLACCRELETQLLGRSGSPGAGGAGAGSRTECDGEPLEPVDRRAVDGFLDACRTDIKGVVLDAQEAYSGRRLQVDHIDRLDIVDVDGANPRATIVSDLRCATNVPSSSTTRSCCGRPCTSPTTCRLWWRRAGACSSRAACWWRRSPVPNSRAADPAGATGPASHRLRGAARVRRALRAACRRYVARQRPQRGGIDLRARRLARPPAAFDFTAPARLWSSRAGAEAAGLSGLELALGAGLLVGLDRHGDQAAHRRRRRRVVDERPASVSAITFAAKAAARLCRRDAPPGDHDRRPRSARSPMASRILCRTNSSANRRASFRSPVSPMTTAFSSEPRPRAPGGAVARLLEEREGPCRRSDRRTRLRERSVRDCSRNSGWS